MSKYALVNNFDFGPTLKAWSPPPGILSWVPALNADVGVPGQVEEPEVLLYLLHSATWHWPGYMKELYPNAVQVAIVDEVPGIWQYDSQLAHAPSLIPEMLKADLILCSHPGVADYLNEALGTPTGKVKFMNFPADVKYLSSFKRKEGETGRVGFYIHPNHCNYVSLWPIADNIRREGRQVVLLGVFPQEAQRMAALFTGAEVVTQRPHPQWMEALSTLDYVINPQPYESIGRIGIELAALGIPMIHNEYKPWSGHELHYDWGLETLVDMNVKGKPEKPTAYEYDACISALGAALTSVVY